MALLLQGLEMALEFFFTMFFLEMNVITNGYCPLPFKRLYISKLVDPHFS